MKERWQFLHSVSFNEHGQFLWQSIAAVILLSVAVWSGYRSSWI